MAKPCKRHPGKLTALGYGHVSIKINGKRVWRAHRVAFWRAHGYLPKNVLHTCDNRWCIEPSHLYDGTHFDNMRDMHSRGRASPGQLGVGSHAAHPLARLTQVQIDAIRLDPRPQRDIAASYGISQSHVSRIKRKIRWK